MEGVKKREKREVGITASGGDLYNELLPSPVNECRLLYWFSWSIVVTYTFKVHRSKVIIILVLGWVRGKGRGFVGSRLREDRGGLHCIIVLASLRLW